MTLLRRWCRNRKTFFGGIAAVFILLIVIGKIVTGSGHHPVATSPTTMTTVRPTVTVPITPGITTPITPTTTPQGVTPTGTPARTVPSASSTTTTAPSDVAPPLPDSAAHVAVEFVTDWDHRVWKPAEWHHNIEALCVPTLASELNSTNPANVPAGVAVTGPAVGSGDRGGASVTVPTSRGAMDVIETLYKGHYRVSSFDASFG